MTNEKKYLQARLTLCLFLKSEAETKGITQQQIADKCGWHQQTVQRMLSGKFSPIISFNKLDLPSPFRPKIQTRSPCSTLKSALFNKEGPPKPKVTARKESKDMVKHDLINIRREW